MYKSELIIDYGHWLKHQVRYPLFYQIEQKEIEQISFLNRPTWDFGATAHL